MQAVVHIVDGVTQTDDCLETVERAAAQKLDAALKAVTTRSRTRWAIFGGTEDEGVSTLLSAARELLLVLGVRHGSDEHSATDVLEVDGPSDAAEGPLGPAQLGSDADAHMDDASERERTQRAVAPMVQAVHQAPMCTSVAAPRMTVTSSSSSLPSACTRIAGTMRRQDGPSGCQHPGTWLIRSVRRERCSATRSDPSLARTSCTGTRWPCASRARMAKERGQGTGPRRPSPAGATSSRVRLPAQRLRQSARLFGWPWIIIAAGSTGTGRTTESPSSALLFWSGPCQLMVPHIIATVSFRSVARSGPCQRAWCHTATTAVSAAAHVSVHGA